MTRPFYSTLVTLTLTFVTAAPAVMAQVAGNTGDSACVEGEWQILNPEESLELYSSEHFVVRWPEELDENIDLTQEQIDDGLELLESFWIYFVDDLGFAEPFCDTDDKYKVSINVSDEGWATGAGTGERYPEMWVHYNAFQSGGVLAHEFAHTLQFTTRGLRNSPYVGWFWESHAEWMRHQSYRDNVRCIENMISSPHIYYGSSRNRYCNWIFWEYIKNQHGYQAIHDIWSQAKKPGEENFEREDPFTVLARNMGWSTSELNDQFGLWAMHSVGWDYINPDGSDQGEIYRDEFGSWDDKSGERYQRVTRLEAVDRDAGHFSVPDAWAPQRWGYNLVRLYPEEGHDGQVSVSFNGVVQDEPAEYDFGSYDNVPDEIPPPDSDWRWGVVALQSDGSPRYSDIQRGSSAEVRFDLQENDQSLWLVVVGTPSTIQQVEWDQNYFTLYRFPWTVHLQGAVPEGFRADDPAPVPGATRHSNGGGWVGPDAEVTETAFVGPYARVLSGIVRDNARVVDHAVIDGGIVQGNAVVGALSVVNEGVTIRGNARVGTTYRPLGAFGSDQTLSGNIQLYGDVELRGSDVTYSEGVFFGSVTENQANSASAGANRTEPPVEVTLCHRPSVLNSCQ
ncbi:MAG: Svx/AvrXca family virulence/avirulence protein [Balneolaceae bacterium]